LSRRAAPIDARAGLRVAALAFLLGIVLAGCETKPPAPTTPPTSSTPRLELVPVSFGTLVGWREDHVAAALLAFRRSCAKLSTLPDEARAGPAGTRVAARDWRPACAALNALERADDRAARDYFEHWFQPYRASDGGVAEGTFTGYFELALRGSRHRSARFNVPIYGAPHDAAAANATRAEIEAGALAGKASILVWVADPIDAFFLSVQGSGRVTLEDGTVLFLGYAAANGHPYRSIGKILVERGAIPLDQVSLQSIGAWLRAHPGEAKPLMDENAHYVFFRKLGSDGPVGSEGVALTPGRSLAVDPAFVSLGAPVWLDAEGIAGGPAIRRLVIAQDTGSAIKGPVRGDLFWGYGPEAERAAGPMRSRGSYAILLPRTLP
jgi:membrane-bound lytic murein transglycosylase A